MKKRIIAAVIGVVLILFAGFYIYCITKYDFSAQVTDGMLDDLDLEGYDKLMIVAHPDDETIWGGSHLLDDKYLVVCMTNGYNDVRAEEFKSVMEKAGCKYIMLSYPDKILWFRSPWTISKHGMNKDIETILEYKDWDTVVTHNEDGEYGHQHHIMTHDIVTSQFDDCSCQGKLMVFGKYYTKEDVGQETGGISQNNLKTKVQLCKMYESQTSTMDKLEHMFPYENWVEIR